MAILSDQELVNSLQTEASIDAPVKFLYEEYFFMIASYIQQNNGTREDAEDIFQEVVLAFLQIVKADKFRGESSVKTFLHAIARNLWLNELKKRGRQEKRNQIFGNEMPLIEPGVAKLMSKQEARRQVFTVIDSLGETCRKILLAFYFEDLSIQDILAKLSYKNEQVVRNKKAKCMKSLDEKIQADPMLAQNLKSALQYE